jgi:hypothetical protein
VPQAHQPGNNFLALRHHEEWKCPLFPILKRLQMIQECLIGNAISFAAHLHNRPSPISVIDRLQ